MTVLNGNDTSPSNEPRTGADFSLAHANAMSQPDIRRAGFGGMLRDEHGAAIGTEQEILEQAIPQQGPPALPWWLGDKFFWKQSANGGRYYLSPKDSFLEYMTEMAPKAAQYGLGLVYPDGQHGVTNESCIVDSMVNETRELLESLRCISETEAAAFERFLIERVTRNAIYAATTQYELEQWAARAEAQGQDASEHQNFGEKLSRLDKFALTAGAAYATVKEVLPQADLSEAAFAKATRRQIFDQANFEGNKLLRPEQVDAQKAASIEAAKVTARRF